MDIFAGELFAGLKLADCRVVQPTFGNPIALDFMRLAELAGLARPSELGITINPRFGSWFGLRGAIFTPDEGDDARPAARACDDCAAPCRGPSELRARREACPVGVPYPDLEIVYHHDRVRGRRLLCERFGVRDELV
jgi:hypothetical protein